MSHSKWPVGAVEDAVVLENSGVPPIKALGFLQNKFAPYKFTYQSVKSFMLRARKRRGAPRAYKWCEEVSLRAQELVRQGWNRPSIAEALNAEFPKYKFYPNDIANHIHHIRSRKGDQSLRFAKRRVPDEIWQKIKHLVKTTELGSREIAESLGLTKGMVIGLLRRKRIQLCDESLRSHGKRPIWKKAPAIKVKKNAGSIMSSLKASDNRARKSLRNESARQIMRHHIVCAGDACHFTERPDYGSHFHTHCCWPVYPDDVAYSDKNSCCNPVELGKPYCSAHEKLAHEYVPSAQVLLPQRPGQMTVSWKRAAA